MVGQKGANENFNSIARENAYVEIKYGFSTFWKGRRRCTVQNRMSPMRRQFPRAAISNTLPFVQKSAVASATEKFNVTKSAQGRK